MTQDFEKLWFGYKTEGEPNSMIIERYCMMNGVPRSQFEKLFRSTCKEILAIQVDGSPEQEAASPSLQSSAQKWHRFVLCQDK